MTTFSDEGNEPLALSVYGAGERGAWPDGHGVVILIPVFNDWESLAVLIPMIDAELIAKRQPARVLVVDDGSIRERGDGAPWGPLEAIERMEVLTLRRNLGHQRAIAIGLAYIEARLEPEAVVVMDGDGEDDPRDIPRLLDRLRAEGGRKIVFAERSRRSESSTFRVFYWLYRQAHYVLTGQRVRVGNFSVIPRRRLISLVAVAEMWNHYAAAAFRSRQPICMIPTQRATRLRGHPTMDFIALVTHGLSAISVYSEVVGVRVLVLAAILAILSVGVMLAVVVIRLATNLAIPGWATFTISLSMILLVQAIMLTTLFSFVILSGRNHSTFLPRRDYENYLLDIAVLFDARRTGVGSSTASRRGQDTSDR